MLSCETIYDSLSSMQVFKTTTEGTLQVTLPDNLFASIVKIVPLATEEGPSVFEIKGLEVFACFEEETSVVSTTAAGTTTVRTTTRFTPTGITTTTVQTTPGGLFHIYVHSGDEFRYLCLQYGRAQGIQGDGNLKQCHCALVLTFIAFQLQSSLPLVLQS
jgi:hypothetical protein